MSEPQWYPSSGGNLQVSSNYVRRSRVRCKAMDRSGIRPYTLGNG